MLRIVNGDTIMLRNRFWLGVMALAVIATWVSQAALAAPYRP
jgi:hypothetical protein